eukprot:CAMPEP_0115511876 /NCGR_PEP_ID=MMETSP0271-20121206/74203_1 /TAXON_ID=71861 /ORGANISM="Scrippsiella trochoidea, Strain CCMP3099" /LENGTH=226 /DNA_ID=CAMNT_0002941983 /DNA_START=434 /DNA_END=1112 /DNA_ORIENTATION=+
MADALVRGDMDWQTLRKAEPKPSDNCKSRAQTNSMPRQASVPTTLNSKSPSAQGLLVDCSLSGPPLPPPTLRSTLSARSTVESPAGLTSSQPLLQAAPATHIRCDTSDSSSQSWSPSFDFLGCLTSSPPLLQAAAATQLCRNMSGSSSQAWSASFDFPALHVIGAASSHQGSSEDVAACEDGAGAIAAAASATAAEAAAADHAAAHAAAHAYTPATQEVGQGGVGG